MSQPVLSHIFRSYFVCRDDQTSVFTRKSNLILWEMSHIWKAPCIPMAVSYHLVIAWTLKKKWNCFKASLRQSTEGFIFNPLNWTLNTCLIFYKYFSNQTAIVITEQMCLQLGNKSDVISVCIKENNGGCLCIKLWEFASMDRPWYCGHHPLMSSVRILLFQLSKIGSKRLIQTWLIWIRPHPFSAINNMKLN